MKASRIFLLAALLALSGAVAAQQAQPAPRPATQPPQAAPRPAAKAQQFTPQEQAQRAKQNQEMTRASQQVMQLIDSNRIGEVWDGSSPAMKRAVTRDEFIKQVTVDRNRLGKAASRGAPVISRAQFPAGAQVPAGLYLNVAVPTKFANTPQPTRELVSFRLDEDRTWRVSGYSVR